MVNIENFNGKIVSSVIQSRKLSFGRKIRTVIISDLHSYTSKEKKAERLAEAIKTQEPEIIFIAGDIFNGGTPWNGGEKYEGIRKFIDNLSEVCPVCITLGNHDLIKLNEENRNIRKRNFQSLENVRPGEVFPLFNDKVIVNGMEIIGYVPRLELMAGRGLKTQLHGLAHDEFIRDYDEKGIKFNNRPGTLNVYLGHDPHLIAASENGVGLGKLTACDFFITGHLHDGYKPLLSSFDKAKRIITGKGLKGLELDKGYTEQNTGVVDKNGEMIAGSRRLWIGPTNLCRGIVYIDNDAQQRFLQLPDGKFYKNASNEPNVQNWKPVLELVAREEILQNKLHYMLISEGIAPGFMRREKLTTINVVDIEGAKKGSHTK